MIIKLNLNFIPSLNRIVRYFIIGDLIMWSGWGLLDPLFSIFVIEKISGATLVSIGLLATIYWVGKGILQIPISLFLDKTDGERDDFYALIFGLMIMSVGAFSLILVDTIWQVYLIQFIKAVGFALYIPAWSAIFSRHLDKDHTAYDWAISSSSVSFGIGAAGFLGGIIASFFGFKLLFLLVGLMGLLSAGMLLLVPDLILPKKSSGPPQVRDHIQMGLK
ncbi:MAG: MFS transporter [bacterium]|nr:MFS transporter [bacterium]